jgi:hypothetical protein
VKEDPLLSGSLSPERRGREKNSEQCNQQERKATS